jgi:hypothetical protein
MEWIRGVGAVDGTKGATSPLPVRRARRGLVATQMQQPFVLAAVCNAISTQDLSSGLVHFYPVLKFVRLIRTIKLVILENKPFKN